MSFDSSKSLLIQSNFQNSYPISINGADRHLKPKIKDVQQYNLIHENKRYFTGKTNPVANQYLLTDYIIKSNDFVNELREFNIKVQETLIFGIHDKMFRGCYSFTGEGYAELEGELEDQQFFSFANGVPYRHYTTSTNKNFNIFFGIECESVYEPVIVIDNMKKKRP